MEAQNPYLAGVDAVQAPDGDTLLDAAFEARFQVPHCPHCAGERMKPDVVFFGENVAQETAAKAMAAVEKAAGIVGGRLVVDGVFGVSPVPGGGGSGQAVAGDQPGQDPGG